MNIDNLEVGDYAVGCEGYAIVKQCIHGNKYYASLNTSDEQMAEDVAEVSDMDEDYIPCCG